MWIALIVTAGCSLAGGGTTPAPDPEVVIAQGVSAAPYQAGVTVTIPVSVRHAVGLDQVTFDIDGVTIATLNRPNPADDAVLTLEQAWLADASGTRTLTVRASRADGASGVDTATLQVVGEVAVDVEPETITEPTTAPVVGSTTEPVESEPESGAEAGQDNPTAGGFLQAVFDRNQNARVGPGTTFARITTFAPGDRADILGQNLDGSWYKVRSAGAGEVWIYAPLVTVAGSIAGVPREAGPATPVPAPTRVPTAAPPSTPTPAPAVNLVLESFGVAVPADNSVQPRCGVPFVARMVIRNDGDAPTSTGLSRIDNVYLAGNALTASSQGALVPVMLDPGDTHTVEYTFNITTFVDEEQRVEFIVDAGNAVAETDETDNQNGITYVLQPGDCSG